MAFDLKAAADDTSFGSGAKLFGADSDGSTNPSKYPISDVWTYLQTLANTWSAAQAMTSAAPQLTLGVNATTLGSIKFFGNTSGDVTLRPTAAAGTATTLTMPATTGTLAILQLAQTWTAAQTISTGTITASSPLLDMEQTWNNGAVTFTAIKLNVTNTASAAASKVIDAQIGGSSVFGVTRAGLLNLGDTLCQVKADTSNRGIILGSASSDIAGFFQFGNPVGVILSSSSFFGWTSGAMGPTMDAMIGRDAAATIRLGNTDAAAPVAQQIRVQSVVAGTSNTAGVNWTFRGSLGTGTGAGGSIIFQTAAAGSSGTSQNSAADTLVLNADNSVKVCAATATPANGSTAARLLFGTTSGFGIYYGSGAPSVSAAQGSLYLRSDGAGTTDRAYVNNSSGSGTSWTALTTAA